MISVWGLFAVVVKALLSSQLVVKLPATKYRSLYYHAAKWKMCKTSFINYKLEMLTKESRGSMNIFVVVIY